VSALVDSVPDNHSPADDAQGRMTVEEFARRTGMSARNIRALQGRGLLPRPVRLGRRVFYLEQHVHRAEAIKDLQRQGYNLFAIGSMLGTGECDPQAAEMAALLERVGTRDPGLIARLQRHGIVGRTADGKLRVARPKPMRTALALRQLGVPLPAAIRIVADILDATEPAAGELVRMVHAGIVENWDRSYGPNLSSTPVLRTQTVITLLSETTRIVLENVGSDLLRGVIDTREAPPAAGDARP
jgi:DNA-binding transcriptional MerR regulator